MAFAVTEHARKCAQSSAEEGTARLGSFAHELRNRLAAATMSFDLLKRGRVGIDGSTGQVLGRSLRGLHALIDLSLAEVRLESSVQRRQRVGISKLVEEVGLEASIDASARGLEFSVTSGEPGVDVEGDPQLIEAAVGNLVQNAFKFSRSGGHVALRTTATAVRVLIEIEDECGGLKPGTAEDIFRPFVQHDANRTGLGLGLSISRESIAAAGGEIRVRDVPGRGCVFTIDLPRQAPP
jgi:signal transduction histidine kinase